MKPKTLLLSISFFCGLSGDSFSQSPDCLWAKRIGGTGSDHAHSVAVDSLANVYTTGTFFGTVDFDPDTTVTFNLTAIGGGSVYVCKFDSSGNFVWAKSIQGACTGLSIAIDPWGNIYVTGYFFNTINMPPIYLTSVGAMDIFIFKFDSSGNLLWGKSMGGGSYDWGWSIAVDGSGNVYTTGYFSNTVDFDPNAGVFTLTAASTLYFNSFVSKLDSSGNFVWAKTFGGPDGGVSHSIALDDSGNIYTTGYFCGLSDLDPGPGVFNLTGGGGQTFISKLNSQGNFVWAKAFDGTGNSIGQFVTLDAAGSVYSTGWFSGTADFDPGAGIFNLTSVGSYDIFISKLDSLGNFVWTKAMGEPNAEYGYSLAHDDFGNLYTTGSFQGTIDFDPGAGTFNLTASGYDVFILKSDSSGNFVWAKKIGGSGDNHGKSLAVDASGNVIIVGDFIGGNIIFCSNTLVNSGQSDAFIAKLASCSAYFTVFPDTVPHNWFAFNHATGVAPLTYTWDWGDGNSSTGATPSHIYSVPGFYNICLTISDTAGCTSTYCDSSTYLFRDSDNNSVITISVLPQTITGITGLNVNTSIVSTLPNPFSNEITMKGTNVKGEVVIYDLSGREMLRWKTLNDETKIDTEFIFPGFYLLQYIEENKATSFKLMKF